MTEEPTGPPQAAWSWGRTENLVLVYLATALWGFLFTTVFVGYPSLSWAIVTIVGTLAIYLGGHKLVGGSLKLAEETANLDWEEDVRKPVRIPDRVRRQLLRKRHVTDDGAFYTGERVVLSYREHPISLTPWTLGGAIIVLGAIELGIRFGHWPICLIVMATVPVVVGARIGFWLQSEWFVTTRRVIGVSGLVGMQLKVMPIIKITDIQVKVTWWANVLAWWRITYLPVGSAHLESAGQQQAISRLPLMPAGAYVARTIQDYAVPPAAATAPYEET